MTRSIGLHRVSLKRIGLSRINRHGKTKSGDRSLAAQNSGYKPLDMTLPEPAAPGVFTSSPSK